MAFRLVALDLDGTLLSSKKVISPRNLSVLRQLAKQGVHICIATGRTLGTALAVTACLDFPHTLAVYNGALVVDQPTGAEMFRRYLNAVQVREVLAYFDAHNLTGRRDVFTDNCWHISPYTDAYSAEAREYRLPSAPIPAPWPDTAAAKAMVTIPHRISRSMLDLVRQELPGYSAALSTATLLEVMAGGVSKGATITRLAQHLGVHPDEVVAFGDQINDIDMLQTAGYGVAMGNAVEEAKRAADHVTVHFDEDGVAVTLESLFCLAAS